MVGTLFRVVMQLDTTSEGGWNPSLKGLSMTGKWMRHKAYLCRLGRYTLEEEAVDRVRWKLSNTGDFFAL